MPAAAVEHCSVSLTWKQLRNGWSNYGYVTGGLGKLMIVDSFEVWLCASSPHQCAATNDPFCFTYSEVNSVFVPWGLNSTLGVARAMTRRRPILPWHLEMYGRAIDFDAAQFRSDLAGMLRHVEPSDIIIVEGPRQVQQPLTMVPEEDDVGCDPPLCYNGYSGSYFGRANYRPKSNVGYFYLSIVIIGPSMRSVNWAQDNLRSSENTVLDTTAIARRTDFMHQWRLLWLAEDVCLESTGKLDPITNKPLVSCSNRTVDVFSSTFSSPMYECPQNTYKDSEAGRCQACPAQKTSTPGASSENQCFSCQPSLNKETQRWTYTYLKCDGKGCNECPANTLSSPGALGLKGCVPQPLLTVTVKGPIDEGSTSEAITSHRWGRPYHATFDPERFQKIISIISGIEYNRVALIRVEDVWNYPASRCRELRGGCMFDVDILLQAQGGEELTAALEVYICICIRIHTCVCECVCV